jgi:hypothetical protein
MTSHPTKLTDAERIHLDHYHWEQLRHQPGPAHEWNIANGIMPHELLPLTYLRKAELEENPVEWYPFEPTERWAPRAENADDFRTRVKEIAEAQSGR